jgi:hypothetical protein
VSLKALDNARQAIKPAMPIRETDDRAAATITSASPSATSRRHRRRAPLEQQSPPHDWDPQPCAMDAYPDAD